MKIHDIIENVQFELGDSFDIELGTTLIETGIIGFTDDGIILESDIKSLALLKTYGAQFEQTDINLNEGRMSEVDVIFQELANGVRDVFTIMMSPETPEETYVAEKLQDMFHDVSEDFGLDPKKDLEKILDQINQRQVDIVIGTQMVTKGHDFPGIALVGILLADASLNLPDFRANEKIGRAHV